jgi:hypothetical protein
MSRNRKSFRAKINFDGLGVNQEVMRASMGWMTMRHEMTKETNHIIPNRTAHARKL